MTNLKAIIAEITGTTTELSLRDQLVLVADFLGYTDYASHIKVANFSSLNARRNGLVEAYYEFTGK